MPDSTPRFPTFTGETIDQGRLRLDALLGFGGFGVVYKATDILDPAQPTYAVKWLGLPYSYYDRSFKDQNRYLAGLERECRNHQRVSSHPNVVSLHRVVNDPDRDCRWMVLDFAAGGDVFEAQARANPFWNNEERTRSIMLQILDAVSYCHSQGVYHRDIKPENILLSPDANTIYLSDFGASTTKRYTSDEEGTVEYMTPEQYCPQFRATTVSSDLFSSSRADIWACAMTLFGMLTGDVAWSYAHPKSESYCSTLTYLRMGELDHVLPVSKGMESLFRDCFEEDPLRRLRLDAMRARIANMEQLYPRRIRGGALGRAEWLDEISQRWSEHVTQMNIPEDSYAPAPAPSPDSINCVDESTIGLMPTSFAAVTNLSELIKLETLESPHAPCPSLYSNSSSDISRSSSSPSFISAPETPEQFATDAPSTSEGIAELDLSDTSTSVLDEDAGHPFTLSFHSPALGFDTMQKPVDVMKTPRCEDYIISTISAAVCGGNHFLRVLLS